MVLLRNGHTVCKAKTRREIFVREVADTSHLGHVARIHELGNRRLDFVTIFVFAIFVTTSELGFEAGADIRLEQSKSVKVHNRFDKNLVHGLAAA